MGDDQLKGDSGNDTLLGMDGNDTIDGGQGNDNIDGGAGTDDLSGGQGHNTYHGDDNSSELKDEHQGDTQVNGTFSGDNGEADGSVLVTSSGHHNGLFAN